MKKQFILLGAIIATLLSGNVYALNYQGFVSTYVSTSYSSAYGTYNVETNPRPGHENSYLKLYTSSWSESKITAYDAVNNRTVSCFLYPGSSDTYKMASKLAASINDGTYVYFRAAADGKCDYIYVAKTSYYQQ